MGSDKHSYKIKTICKQCNKFISNTPARIKAHLLKCKGENDGDEIASIVKVWDKKISSTEKPKKVMPSETDFHDGDGGGGDGGPPIKNYDYERWREIKDAKYLDKVIDYEKFPNKRDRSDSDSDSDNSPDSKRFKEEPRYWSESYDSEESSVDGEKRPIKRSRSYTDSNESDYSPDPKRYKKNNMYGGKRRMSNESEEVESESYESEEAESEGSESDGNESEGNGSEETESEGNESEEPESEEVESEANESEEVESEETESEGDESEEVEPEEDIDEDSEELEEHDPKECFKERGDLCRKCWGGNRSSE